MKAVDIGISGLEASILEVSLPVCFRFTYVSNWVTGYIKTGFAVEIVFISRSTSQINIQCLYQGIGRHLGFATSGFVWQYSKFHWNDRCRK